MTHILDGGEIRAVGLRVSMMIASDFQVMKHDEVEMYFFRSEHSCDNAVMHSAWKLFFNCYSGELYVGFKSN